MVVQNKTSRGPLSPFVLTTLLPALLCSCSCMAFLLDPLMATLGHEADNLSFLLLLTDTILTSDYVDATVPTSITAKEKLHAVVRSGCPLMEGSKQVSYDPSPAWMWQTRVCRDYLQSKIKMQENLQASRVTYIRLYILDKQSLVTSDEHHQSQLSVSLCGMDRRSRARSTSPRSCTASRPSTGPPPPRPTATARHCPTGAAPSREAWWVLGVVEKNEAVLF